MGYVEVVYRIQVPQAPHYYVIFVESGIGASGGIKLATRVDGISLLESEGVKREDKILGLGASKDGVIVKLKNTSQIASIGKLDSFFLCPNKKMLGRSQANNVYMPKSVSADIPVKKYRYCFGQLDSERRVAYNKGI